MIWKCATSVADKPPVTMPPRCDPGSRRTTCNPSFAAAYAAITPDAVPPYTTRSKEGCGASMAGTTAGANSRAEEAQITRTGFPIMEDILPSETHHHTFRAVCYVLLHRVCRYLRGKCVDRHGPCPQRAVIFQLGIGHHFEVLRRAVFLPHLLNRVRSGR